MGPRETWMGSSPALSAPYKPDRGKEGVAVMAANSASACLGTSLNVLENDQFIE